MPVRRHRWIVLGVSAALIASLAAAWLAFSPTLTTPPTPERAPSGATWVEPARPPTPALVPTAPGVAGLADREWLAESARRTGVPERALAAYAGVAIEKARQMPECGLSWNTLAGIGFVESRHGSYGGSEIAADGTVTPGIFGIALVGGATATIVDSDEGRIDGDAEWDRAVGPMQLIPQTWRNWHVDANLDGSEDPQNIDDATMAAANYLCRASGDMAHEEGWAAGITAYNSDPAYRVSVAAAGVSYRE